MSLVLNRMHLCLNDVGARHANQVDGLACLINNHRSDAKSPGPFYDPDAHASDIATVLHRTPPLHVLRGGGKVWTKYIKQDFEGWV